MNMIRRTSSVNQLSSEAALIASHTAAIPISMPARIQNSERAAFITVVSQPFAAVTTEFSSVVRTEPCWARAGVVASRMMQIEMNESSSFREGRTITIAVSSPARHGRCDPDHC
ncbi:hypothetical protein shn_34500 (plasmid) [Shinella sp. HZN7]|nr:hypothetical protein shn_34500 [Shinella sp. HZN7]